MDKSVSMLKSYAWMHTAPKAMIFINFNIVLIFIDSPSIALGFRVWLLACL